MKGLTLLCCTVLLCATPAFTEAKQLLKDGDFNQTEHWSIAGHCESQPANCIYQASEQDLIHLGSVQQYFLFGKKDSIESMSQVVRLDKYKKKLHLKLKLKLYHPTKKHYKQDAFTIIVTGKEFGHSWRKDITYSTQRKGWQQLDYNLKDIVKINKGKKIVVSFFIANDAAGTTKAQLTKIRLKQYN